MLSGGDDPLVDHAFEAEIIHWRGPGPFLFVPVPRDRVVVVAWAARQASHGWGSKGTRDSAHRAGRLFPASA